VGKDGNWFAVEAPLQLAQPNEMFLMLGGDPTSYVIPFFPKDSHFVRMEANLNPSPDTLLYKKRKEAVIGHQGALFSYGLQEPTQAQQTMLAAYGLRRDGSSCIPLQTNIETLTFCALTRSVVKPKL
jgi:hypothetical protein